MICTVYVRRPSFDALLLTTTQYRNAALAIVEEIVQRRGLPWTTEVAEWVPAGVNTFVQAATSANASTITLNGDPVAVTRTEIDDIILAAAQSYLTRRGGSGTLALVPGVSAGIKAAIDAAPHTEP